MDTKKEVFGKRESENRKQFVLINKAVASFVAAFFIFYGIPMPVSFADDKTPPVSRTGRPSLPILTLEQANARQTVPTQGRREIPSDFLNQDPQTLTPSDPVSSKDVPPEPSPAPTGGPEQAPPPPGIYDPSKITVLSNQPYVGSGVGGGTVVSGKIQTVQSSSRNVQVSYQSLGASEFAFVYFSDGYFESGQFHGTTMNLSSGINVALNGAAGQQIKLELKDLTGQVASFYLTLSGSLQNYDITAAMLSSFFPAIDKSKIAQVVFVIENPKMGANGTVAIETAGLAYTPFISTPTTAAVTDFSALRPSVSPVEAAPGATVTGFTQPSPDQFSLGYRLGGSSTQRWAAAQIVFNPGQYFNATTSDIVLGMNLTGSMDYKIEVIDAAGKKVTLRTSITNGKIAITNALLQLAGVPGFDASQVKAIVLVVADNYGTGVMTVNTKGLYYEPMIAGAVYNPTLITALPNSPSIGSGQGSAGGVSNGTIAIVQSSSRNFSMNYTLADNDDFVFSFLNAGASTANLSGGLTLAVNGPAGKQLKLELRDALGRMGFVYLNLTGSLQNYTIPMSLLNIDPTAVYQITFVADKAHMGSTGLVSVETKGMAYTPVITSTTTAAVTDFSAYQPSVSPIEPAPFDTVTNFNQTSSNQFTMSYNLMNAPSAQRWAAAQILFNPGQYYNATNSGIVLGVNVPGASYYKVEVEDANGKKVVVKVGVTNGNILVTNAILQSAEIPGFDSSKIKAIVLVVDDPSVTTGVMTVNTRGLVYTPVIAPDPTLNSTNTTRLPGNPVITVVSTTGSDAQAGIDPRGVSVTYNTGTAGWAGGGLTFDDFGTAAFETADLSGFSEFIFGLKGNSDRVKLEFIDANGGRDFVYLIGIQSGTEKIFRIPAGALEGVDLSKMRLIYVIVEGLNKQGTMDLYHVPSLPAGWTLAASNPNYAFQVRFRGTVSLRDYSLYMRDLKTGQETVLASGGNYYTSLSYPFYDVSPDGKYAIYVTHEDTASPSDGTYVRDTTTIKDLQDASRSLSIPGAAQSVQFPSAAEMVVKINGADIRVDLLTMRIHEAGLEGTLYSPALITALPNSPSVASGQGSAGGVSNGMVMVSQSSSRNFSMNYTLADSDDFVFSFLNTGMPPANLSGGLTLAVNGPAGRQLKLELKDSSGAMAFIYLNLTGSLQNYTIPMSLLNINRTSVVQIAFVADKAHMGSAGLVSVETKGLAYTPIIVPDPSLNSTNTTRLPGNPIITVVSTEGATATAGAHSRGVTVDYNTGTAGWAGGGLTFDNFGTPAFETADLSGFSEFIFGLKGNSDRVKLEFIDANGGRDFVYLTGIQAGAEKIFRIPAGVLEGVDLSKMRLIYVIVEGLNRQGTIDLYHVPSLPAGWTLAASNPNYAVQVTNTNPSNPMAGNEVVKVLNVLTGLVYEAYNKPASAEDVWGSVDTRVDVSPDGKYVVFSTRVAGGGNKVYVHEVSGTTAIKHEFLTNTGSLTPNAPANPYHYLAGEIRIDMVNSATMTSVGEYRINTATWQGVLNLSVPSGWTRAASNANFAFQMETSGSYPHASNTLKVMNLVTGESKMVARGGSLDSVFGAAYDVSPDGQNVLYSMAEAKMPDGSLPFRTYFYMISNGARRMALDGEFKALVIQSSGITLQMTHRDLDGTELQSSSVVDFVTVTLGIPVYSLVKQGSRWTISNEAKLAVCVRRGYAQPSQIMMFDTTRGLDQMKLLASPYAATSYPGDRVTLVDIYLTPEGKGVVSYASDNVYAQENRTVVLFPLTQKQLILETRATAVTYTGSFARYEVISKTGVTSVVFVDLQSLTVTLPPLPAGKFQAGGCLAPDYSTNASSTACVGLIGTPSGTVEVHTFNSKGNTGVMIYDNHQKQILSYGIPSMSSVTPASFSPDGKYLAVSGQLNQVAVFSLMTPAAQQSVSIPQGEGFGSPYVSQVKFVSATRILVVVDDGSHREFYVDIGTGGKLTLVPKAPAGWTALPTMPNKAYQTISGTKVRVMDLLKGVVSDKPSSQKKWGVFPVTGAYYVITATGLKEIYSYKILGITIFLSYDPAKKLWALYKIS